MIRIATAVVIAAAITTAGCSSGDTAAPTVSTAPAAATSSTAATPSRALSPRGNDVRKPGDMLGWKLKDGSGTITAVFSNFVIAGTCTGGGPPQNGAYLTFDLQVTTPPSPAVATAGSFFHRDGYSVVGPDGVTVKHLWTDATYACTDLDQQWSDDLTPGATFKGKVVLDIPAGSTVLAFNPAGNDHGGGDEWPLPVSR